MLSKTESYFITIVKERSLQQAAQILYVSQPSLTKYIQRLEKQLGVRLFDRTVSPMRLTDAGQLYYTHLLQRQEKDQQLLAQLAQMQNQQRGTLRLGIPSYCGQCWLPGVIGTFHRDYPHVEIDLYEDHGIAIEKALLERQIDLGILHLPVRSEGLHYEKLFTETVLLAYPGQDQEIPLRSFDDFAHLPFIMPHPEQKLGRVVTEAMAAANFSADIFLRSENVMTMLSLVSQGLGAGFLPAGGLRSLPAQITENVRFCRLKELERSDWDLIALYRSGSYLPAYTRHFIRLFSQLSHRADPRGCHNSENMV